METIYTNQEENPTGHVKYEIKDGGEAFTTWSEGNETFAAKTDGYMLKLETEWPTDVSIDAEDDKYAYTGCIVVDGAPHAICSQCVYTKGALAAYSMTNEPFYIGNEDQIALMYGIDENKQVTFVAADQNDLSDWVESPAAADDDPDMDNCKLSLFMPLEGHEETDVYRFNGGDAELKVGGAFGSNVADDTAILVQTFQENFTPAAEIEGATALAASATIFAASLLTL